MNGEHALDEASGLTLKNKKSFRIRWRQKGSRRRRRQSALSSRRRKKWHFGIVCTR
jgi:hypothetical protein